MKNVRNIFIVLVLVLSTIWVSANAQQVSTLYFLENAPMRHTVNPAFQPVSSGYINLTPIGNTSFWVGNNSLTMRDVVYMKDGSTITAAHPDADKEALLKQIRNVALFDNDLVLGLFNMGTHIGDRGYLNIGINERIEGAIGLNKSFFEFVLNGGMQNTTGVNTLDMSKTLNGLNMYSEISAGYSHKINDKWTVGGKLKLVIGQLNASMRFNELTLDANAQQWRLHGTGVMQAAAPLNWNALPEQLSKTSIQNTPFEQLVSGLKLQDFVKPQGYGAALDMGFTYKPHKQVQIAAAINDLGFVVWNGVSYNVTIDTTYTGAKLQYSDYANAENGYQFNSDLMTQDILDQLGGIIKGVQSDVRTNKFTRMLSAKLNVGVDANFCNNILGVGIVSKTRLVCNRIEEEVTIGGAVRPCNWFNLAVSYSLVNNGKFSNIGAGISLMPYDGINLTLAMDYIPTVYAYKDKTPIPYQTKGINLAMGLNIVWGTNKKRATTSSSSNQESNDRYKHQSEEHVQNDQIAKNNLIDPLKVYDLQDRYLSQQRGDTLRTPVDSLTHDLMRDAMYSIQFKKESEVWKSSSEVVLNKIVRCLMDHPDYKTFIYVYTDNSLPKESSLNLSNSRAKAIMNYLTKAGVPEHQLYAEGKGQEQPIATNRIKEGRERNNRVMFYIQ